MNSFKSNRLVHEYTQTNSAAPEKVFPLLCPVREVDWLPGWQHRLIYSDSGFAELDLQLAGAGLGRTLTKIRYRYTALSSEGNRQLESYDRKWFEARMENWERCINHYLCTGNKIAN